MLVYLIMSLFQVSLVNASTTELTFNVSCSTCIMELEENMAPNPLNLTLQGTFLYHF